MPMERRYTLRVPDNRLITEIVSERPSAASIVNVSNTGLFTVKKTTMDAVGHRLIQMEIPVPEASESIWAVGEVMFERYGMSCLGSGIRFVTMADKHRRLIRDLVEYRKRDVYSLMQEELRAHKDLTATTSPFTQRPAPLSENTVRMYLLPNH